MLRALKNRSIALLWSGQALSAIGDEIYRVALIWLAVGLIGSDTGYLAAGQAAALLGLSLIGGKWSDHRDDFATMITVDTLRGLIVLVPVVAVHFVPLSLSILLFVALSISGLGAFFDPALQAALPRFSPDVPTLRAATGLMSTTIRLARVAGPAIIGVLTAFLPAIHFFTLDALTFAVSAISIVALKNHPTRRHLEQRKRKPATFKETLLAGFKLIHSSHDMPYFMYAKAVLGGAWNLSFTLGFALLVHSIAPHDVRVFGWVVGSYGIGNLAGALVLGNLERRKPVSIMFKGYVWLGLGFVGVALAPNVPMMMLAAAIAAIGGPMNDLPFVDIVQNRFDISVIAKVFRLRMALETAATLVCMVTSPLILKIVTINKVIGVCGFLMAVIGVVGFFRYSDPQRPTSGQDAP